MGWQILHGDCRDVLATIDAGSVHCCVTSPPYFGLRDYGSDRQIGLEPTPDAYVAEMVGVFREVRRVLRDDGTVWLNLGDSYNAYNGNRGASQSLSSRADISRAALPTGAGLAVATLKPKDLIGIPWMVARALQEPYYTGRIRRERDRVWLAAMIDGEGTICGFDHTRADDGSHRSGVHVAITNTSEALLDEAARIWPTSRSAHQRPHAGHLGTKESWRWIVHGIENKMAALRELYPYLIAKRQQAVVAYTLLMLMADAKRLGHSPQKDSVLAQRRVLTGLLSDLNHQRPVTLPAWLVEPPSLYEPGYYLRSDVIWSKSNPMPESVTDRPTKAHEYVFLLAKAERYFFDAEAVRESLSEISLQQIEYAKRHTYEGARRTKYAPDRGGGDRALAAGGRHAGAARGAAMNPDGRNIRTVWPIATQPFSGAHFATMPPALAERCIKAGCPVGGIVLDPFAGAGTTGLVADRLGRNFVGVELNAEYAEMARRRIYDDAPLLNMGAA